MATHAPAFGEKAVWGQFSGMPSLTFLDRHGPDIIELGSPPGLTMMDGLAEGGSHFDNNACNQELMDSPMTRDLLGASFCSLFEDTIEDSPRNVNEDMKLHAVDSLFGDLAVGVPFTKLARPPGFPEKVIFSSQSSHEASSTAEPSQTSASSDVEQDSPSKCTAPLSFDQATRDTITAVASQLFTSADFDMDGDLFVAQKPRRQVTLPEPEPAPSTPKSEERKGESHATKARTKLRSEAKEFKPGAFDGLWQEHDCQADWTWSERSATDCIGGYPAGAKIDAEMLAAASFGVQVASAVAHLNQLQAGQKSNFDDELDLPKSMTPKLNAAVSRREQAAIANVVQQNVQALKMRNQISQNNGASNTFDGNNLLKTSVVGDRSLTGDDEDKLRAKRRFCHLCGKSVQPFFKFCASCGGRIDV